MSGGLDSEVGAGGFFGTHPPPVIARSLRRSTAKQRRKPISRVSERVSDTRQPRDRHVAIAPRDDDSSPLGGSRSYFDEV